LSTQQYYKITHIPDGSDPQARILCNGDVCQAIYGQFRGLLRLICDLPDISEVRLVYHYDGKKLELYFITDGTTLGHKQIAEIFFNSFPGDLFGYEMMKAVPVIPGQAHAVHVSRRDCFIPSSVTNADNPKALNNYYSIEPFQCNNSCDHMPLEQALSQLQKPVTIDLSFKSTDVRNYVCSIATYQRRLRDINSSSQATHFPECRPEGEWAGIDRNQRVNDPVVDDVRKAMSKVQLSLTRPNLKFGIEISSSTLSTAQYIASVFAENTYQAGSYQLSTTKEIVETQQNASRLFKELRELRFIASVEELESTFRLPVSGVRKPAVIRCHTDPPDYSTDKILVVGKDIVASTKNRPIVRGPLIQMLDRHLALFGSTGSGKSVLCFSMLLQMAKMGVPFLVIEAGGKTDYRAMIEALKRHPDKKMQRLGRKIRLLTPGEESINPIRLNPFLPLEGVPIMLHAENMLSCLLASAEWPDPLPALLRKGLHAMYHDYQFQCVKPNMSRFCDYVKREFDKLDYERGVKGNILSALEARLSVFMSGAIGRIFQTESNSPSLDDLAEGFTIIECAMLAEDAIAFVSFTLMTMISERFSVLPHFDSKPRLIFILEEAHGLVPPAPVNTMGNGDNPKAKASRLFSKELLEARAKGYSIWVIDQSPGNVDSNVLKSCTTTILGKQREPDDIHLVEGSMMFSPADCAAVKQLNTGQFLVFTEEYRRPCLVQAPDICKELNLNGTPSGRAIIEHIKDGQWYNQDLRNRVTEELSMLNERLCDFEVKLNRAIRVVATILNHRDLQAKRNAEIRKLTLKSLQVIDDFFRLQVVPLAGLDNELPLPSDINKFRDIVLKRFEVSKNIVNQFVKVINKRKGTDHE